MHVFPFARSIADHPFTQPSVVTIGNFDGVHLGHQQLLSAVKAQASALSALSTVLLFEPQPMEFFCPHCAPARLMPLNNKLRQLRALGIDQVAIVQFTHSFSQRSAEAFVTDLLLKRLSAQAVWVGDDFRFGVGRSGDFSLMKQLGHQHGFDVSQTPSLMRHGRRVSSTWIRESLAEGKMSLAEALIGMPYRIYGRVMHGQKLGRVFGFPTMNINLPHPLAVSGVFAVKVYGLGENALSGVANLGVRPSVEGSHQQRLEVHLLNWQGSAYGQKIEVVFCHRLRSEKKFNNLDELKHQIQQDVMQATAWHQQETCYLPKITALG